eukprot:7879923-Pyramimonas_sp.AAC.1
MRQASESANMRACLGATQVECPSTPVGEQGGTQLITQASRHECTAAIKEAVNQGVADARNQPTTQASKHPRKLYTPLVLRLLKGAPLLQGGGGLLQGRRRKR